MGELHNLIKATIHAIVNHDLGKNCLPLQRLQFKVGCTNDCGSLEIVGALRIFNTNSNLKVVHFTQYMVENIKLRQIDVKIDFPSIFQ